MPYQEYFKFASEGLIVVDRQGRIVETNPAVEQLFGYSKAELLGRPIELLIPEKLRDIHVKHRDGYLGAPCNRPMGRGLSLAGRRKDRSEFPLEIGLTYAAGTSHGDVVVASVTDISERLALEDEARRGETLISLGTLAAGIAHDLSNPLQVIRSRSELILDFPDTTSIAEVREDLGAIHRQARRAGQIVEEFLELSRRNGKSAESVDVNDLIERVLFLLGESMRRSRIVLEARLDRTAPRISGHPVGLERVLINLLTNASDAMPDGGSVKICVDSHNGPPGSLRLLVADNGPGIPPDALGKIFSLFYTTKEGGSGLGLWLSRRIIREHNGEIEVQSELGKGTTFTISLPTGYSLAS